MSYVMYIIIILYNVLTMYIIIYRETFTSDYEAVQERLATLPKKLTHDIMVSDRTIRSFNIENKMIHTLPDYTSICHVVT